MKRPLFLVCMLFVFLLAWGILTRPAGADADVRILKQQAEPVIYAKAVKKDSEKLILSAITVMDRAAPPQQNNPLKINQNLIIPYEEIENKILPLEGQHVVLTGIFSEYSHATNPGEMDMADYYSSLKICGRLKSVKILQYSEEYSHFGELLFGIRMKSLDRINSVFPQEYAAVMSAVLVGEKAGLSAETKNLYKRNGILHILSISGLHVSMMGMGLFRLLRKTGLPVWLAVFIGGTAMVLYGCFAGMGISVFRAVGMYLIRLLSLLFKRTYDMLTAMGILSVLAVLDNPFCVKNTGFLLSYGAILGVGIYNEIRSKSRRGQGRGRYVENKVLDFCLRKLGKFKEDLKGMAEVSMAVYAVTLPVLLSVYFEVPVYSTVINLFVVPFMGILLAAGVLAVLLPGGRIIGKVDCAILDYYENLCNVFESGRLPFGTWNPGAPSVWKIVLYYVALMGGIFLLERVKREERKGGRPGMPAMRAERKRRNISRVIQGMMLTIMVIIMAMPVPHGTELYFLDVGQGDGMVLWTKQGNVYIFDFGSTSRNKVGEYVLKPFLKYKGIGEVTAVILSHEDADHINGVVELIENGRDWGISVDEILLPEVKGERFQSIVQALDDAVKEEGTRTPRVGCFNAGLHWLDGGVEFLCLHPDKGAEYGDANAASGCFLISTDGVNALLTGDVQGEGEERLKENLKRYKELFPDNFRVDILKVSHHGSRNSTDEEFLSLAKPRCSVLSCGRNNRYGHPHKELMERLGEARTAVFRTDARGAVTVRFKKNGFEVETWEK